jgi:hypothetical protein
MTVARPDSLEVHPVTSRRLITLIALIAAVAVVVVLFFATDSYALVAANRPGVPHDVRRQPSMAGPIIRWSLLGLTASATLLLTLRPRLGR